MTREPSSGSTRSARADRADPAHRISGPAELVQAVPYLLGFHPAASLVLVGLADDLVVVTARIDLADAFAGAVPHTVAAMERGGTRQLLAVVYPAPDDVRGPAASDVDDRVVALVHDADVGCGVRDILCVARGHWRSLECQDPRCCPAEAQPLPDGPSAFAAAATVSGVVALADREALARQFDAEPTRDGDAMAALLASAEHEQHEAVLAGRAKQRLRAVKRALYATARALDEPDERRLRAVAGAARVDDATVARFAVALTETAVRDAVWLAVDARRTDGRALWREIARRVPAPYDAPGLFLFGWASWRAGNGALANIAADRAITSDPTYSAADLLLAALTQGVDPRSLPRLRLPRPA